MFSVENVLFVNMTKSFRLWEQGIISHADLVGVVDREKQLDDDALAVNDQQQSLRERPAERRQVLPRPVPILSHGVGLVRQCNSPVPELLHASGLLRL